MEARTPRKITDAEAMEILERVARHQSGGYPLDTALITYGPGVMEDETDQIDGAASPIVVAFIEDMEGDVFAVEFGPVDDEIVINTEKTTYVMLHPNTLAKIIRLRGEANALWRELDKHWDGEGWAGWDHLATAPEPIEGA